MNVTTLVSSLSRVRAIAAVASVHLILTATGAAQCGTTGCGTLIRGDVVNKVWTKAGNPYCVIGNTSVSLLTIRPGVIVQVCPNVRITVKTWMKAVGTSNDPIVFQRKVPTQAWLGISLPGPVPTQSTLTHCRIEGANSSGLTITNTVPRIDNCTFANNTTSGHGGGVHASFSSGRLTMSHCLFVGNKAIGSSRVGGGLYVTGDYTLRRCRFEGNSSQSKNGGSTTNRGGAIYMSTGTGSMENCLVTGNVVSGLSRNQYAKGAGLGAGVYVASGKLTATSCLFSKNYSTASGIQGWTTHGSNIYLLAGTLDLSNCTITRGTSRARAYGGVYLAGGTTTIKNSILWHNHGAEISGRGAVTVAYSNVQGPVFKGTKNINFDPAFALGCDFITFGSPCMDTGDPSMVDSAMPPGLGKVTSDMGMHGGPLANQWLPAKPTLTITPNVITKPVAVTITTEGGIPTTPYLFCLIAVNGKPVDVPLPFGLFCHTGSWTTRIPSVAPVKPNTFTFITYVLTRSGGVTWTNSVTVR